jgi:hypothetical protein
LFSRSSLHHDSPCSPSNTLLTQNFSGIGSLLVVRKPTNCPHCRGQVDVTNLRAAQAANDYQAEYEDGFFEESEEDYHEDDEGDDEYGGNDGGDDEYGVMDENDDEVNGDEAMDEDEPQARVLLSPSPRGEDSDDEDLYNQDQNHSDELGRYEEQRQGDVLLSPSPETDGENRFLSDIEEEDENMDAANESNHLDSEVQAAGNDGWGASVINSEGQAAGNDGWGASVINSEGQAADNDGWGASIINSEAYGGIPGDNIGWGVSSMNTEGYGASTSDGAGWGTINNEVPGESSEDYAVKAAEAASTVGFRAHSDVDSRN